MLLGLDLAVGDAVALGERRQAAAVVVLGVIVLALLDHAHAVVAAFLVDLEEAVELHDGAGGAQHVELAVAALDLDVGGGLLQLGGRHLARDGALPDQLVEPRLVALEIARDVLRAARDVGRADRLVRFLRVLGLGLVLADERRARSAANTRARSGRGWR